MLFLSVCQLRAQTYTHPTAGVNGTNCGNCVVNTNSGTYYDDGGAGGNYSTNINQVYRVFCPNTAGTCMRITFTSFAMEGMADPAGPPPLDCYFDWLTIGNGSTQNSPVIDQLPSSPASTTGRICGIPTTPFTYTATSANGCLSIRMNSNGSNVFAGWAATISPIVCAGGPPGNDRTDCPNRVQICNDLPITFNSPGPGLISEACSGCSVQEGEDHSAWYVFQVQAGGTIALNITPANPADDYDFVIYGPGATCASLGSPIRCSYACTSGNTGLGNAAVDVTEQCGGNGWVAPMPVTAGQIYYMMVNHWDPPVSGYTLDWVMSGGATLNCVPLPVELTDFKCEPYGNEIDLYWATSAEVNNNYFVLERSIDGENFQELRTIPGKGFSNETTEYIANDPAPHIGLNYYRLKQVDYDGNEKIYNSISCTYGTHLQVIREINIYDLNEHLILNEKENTKDLESIVTQLTVKPGMYMMYITYDNGTTNVKKFVKI
jgi:hypothetical protein